MFFTCNSNLSYCLKAESIDPLSLTNPSVEQMFPDREIDFDSEMYEEMNQPDDMEEDFRQDSEFLSYWLSSPVKMCPCLVMYETQSDS